MINLDNKNLPAIPYLSEVYTDLYEYREHPFDELDWLYANGLPVFIGDRGEIFIVELNRNDTSDISYYNFIVQYNILIKNFCTQEYEFREFMVTIAGNESIYGIKQIIKKEIMNKTRNSLEFYK